MHIENKRLLAGLQESIDGLATLSDTQQAKTFQAAATTILGELLRRDNPQQIADNYALGLACGNQLVAALAAEGKPAPQGAKQMAKLPTALNAASDIEVGFALLDRLRAALTLLVDESGYPATASKAIDAAVLALFDWEFSLCRLPAPQQAAARSAHDMKAVLERSTRAQGGDFSNARVTSLTTLHGGFGKSTTLFEVSDKSSKGLRLVSRAMQDIPLLDLPSQDIGKEFHMLRYAFKRGICVAEPLWLENDKQTHGVRFLVSRQVSGRNFGSAVSSEPLSAAQVKSLATELAKIHNLTLDPEDADLQQSAIDAQSTRRSLAEIVDEYLQLWYRLWRRIDAGPYPVVEATFKWLMANLPHPEDLPVFLHGDYALHNILIDGDAVSGVLDWEMYHVGDRAEDISWLLSSIGKHVSPEQFMTEYLAQGGRPVSQFQLKYYEVLVHLKLLIVTLEAQLRFRLLPQAGPHFCILGLNFIQHPAACLAQAIRDAEKVR